MPPRRCIVMVYLFETVTKLTAGNGNTLFENQPQMSIIYSNMTNKNQIQVFQNDSFGNLRTVADETGKVWFCLADICKCLALTQTNKVKDRLKESGCIYAEFSEECNVLIINTHNRNMGVNINELTKGGNYGNRIATFVDEPNLYRCIFQSRKAEAEKFQDWVFEDVLPAIHNTGSYSMKPNADVDKKILLLSQAVLIADKEMKRLTAENTQQKQAISELQISNNELAADNNALKEGNKNLTDTNIVLAEHNAKQKEQIQSQQEVITKAQPKVEYYDMAMSSNTQYTTNEIALELHTTAVMLNRRLNADGIQYKQGDCWLLSAKYRDCGYTEIRTYEVYGNDGQVIKRKPMMRWTEKGRQFLLQKYGRHENNM